LSTDKLVNAEMIRNILSLRYDPSCKTSLSKKTWEDFSEKSLTGYNEFIEQSIKNKIKDSLINSKESHVSVALSGGIDSTLVIALLRKTFPEIQIDAISVRFADSIDESEKATKIAEHFEATPHIIEIKNYLEELPKAISIIKMPFWDIHWFYVVKKASSLSKILVSGDGGDELFAGYTFRYKNFLSNLKSSFSTIDKVKLYLNCHQRDWVPDQDKLFGKKINFSWESIYSMLSSYFDNPLSAINQIFLADFNGKLLYNWIPLNKNIHEFFGVESLTPILSQEMISYATHLSNKIKYDEANNIGKIPLRSILKKYVPDELISPTKQGFSVNTVNLWNTGARQLCEKYLLHGNIVKDGWINSEWINSNLSKMKNEPDVRYVNKFLGLLAFEIWYRLFITKEMKPDTIL
jgi:asparagine synthase (glutamine-hydrolysing)